MFARLLRGHAELALRRARLDPRHGRAGPIWWCARFAVEGEGHLNAAAAVQVSALMPAWSTALIHRLVAVLRQC